MCAACVDFNDPDAPPVAVIIADIKKKLRRQRCVKWAARALASVFAFFVCYFTLQTFDGASYMVVFALTHMFLTWKSLKIAEAMAYRVDHTAKHLRITQALVITGVLEDPNADTADDN